MPAPHGRTTWRGWPVCTCMAQTLPLIEAEMITAGVIKKSIDIMQGAYSDGSLSAGTHAGGGAIDTDQYSPAALTIWRSWGVPTFHRTPAQGFADHGHGIWSGCPDLSPAAADQVKAYERGRNGLASNGRDDGPEPDDRRRTWQQALEIHTKPPATPAPTPRRREMDLKTTKDPVTQVRSWWAVGDFGRRYLGTERFRDAIRRVRDADEMDAVLVEELEIWDLVCRAAPREEIDAVLDKIDQLRGF